MLILTMKNRILPIINQIGLFFGDEKIITRQVNNLLRNITFLNFEKHILV